MDPLSVVSLATEGLGICIKVISMIKRYASAIKNVRKDMLALLKQVERMRNIFGLLRSLMLELCKMSKKVIQLEIDKAECEKTLEELETLATDIQKKKQFIAGIQWGAKKISAAQLTQKLREQEEQIVNIVTIIGTTSSLRKQLEIEEFKKDAVTHFKSQSAFEDLALIDGVLQSPTEVSGQYKPLRTWLGHVLRTNLSEHYLLWRDRLSDAAYWGRWDDIWDILKTGNEEYSESWVSAIRLKSLEESDNMSFWTPLHQAVYNRAPIEVVQKLIDAGAFRTVRSRRTDFSYMDMTPLDLAHELGFSYLFDILSPVIRNSTPLATLMSLQERFHDIIRDELGDRVENERIYLPLLEASTEIGEEPIWFPVKFSTSGAGYVYQLDERTLIVRSINIRGKDIQQTYRITKEEILEDDGALVSNN